MINLSNLAVNTGVGASANTRTKAVEGLQQAIIKHLNCGILNIEHDSDNRACGPRGILSAEPTQGGEYELLNLPPSWAKAAHLVRINALAGGRSGIRAEVLHTLVKILQADITPNIPLRGSISASGDLSPLSYLAAIIQGGPGTQVWVKDGSTRRLTSAGEALARAGIQPLAFAPKEALSIVNGTAVSAGAAALAMQDAHGCTALGQILTAMAVEALNGTDESFDPYLAEVRPHPGQAEAAQNMLHFLKDSKLIRRANTDNTNGLRQDRYSLRTAPQWLGPEIENMLLAHKQIAVECDAITDNPLIKDDSSVLQGGNFQAYSVTSAMDKTRAALHAIGRMLYQQSAELMNPIMNNGLPPNLTADEPSCDFLFKGIDVASASYQSELAFLSHGTTPFVMVAEHGNQSLNSLGLISTRYTHRAIDIYVQLCANSILALCQALDLRAAQLKFESAFEPLFYTKLCLDANDISGNGKEAADVRQRLWLLFKTSVREKSSLDAQDRFSRSLCAVVSSMQSLSLDPSNGVTSSSYADLNSRRAASVAKALEVYKATLEQHSIEDTLPFLGRASRRIYSFVRKELGVPFLRSDKPGPQGIPKFRGVELGTTIGTFVSRIYRALKRGEMIVPVMECLEDAMQHEEKATDGAVKKNGHNGVHMDGESAEYMNGRAKKRKALD